MCMPGSQAPARAPETTSGDPWWASERNYFPCLHLCGCQSCGHLLAARGQPLHQSKQPFIACGLLKSCMLQS